jgi:hypothetical protein
MCPDRLLFIPVRSLLELVLDPDAPPIPPPPCTLLVVLLLPLFPPPMAAPTMVPGNDTAADAMVVNARNITAELLRLLLITQKHWL